MAKRLYELRVKTGTYKDKMTGETKNAYDTVGAVMEWDDGSQSVKMKRTFNPAGVPGEGDITIYMNEPQSKEARAATGGSSQPQTPPPAFDDEIPVF